MYQIAVSGAAKGKSVKDGGKAAYSLGAEIARRGHIVFTGATRGLPYQAAKGAHEAHGKSVGFSPAASYFEHTRKYRLPADAYDVIIYTGLHYVGRDLMLVQSSEALVSIGGRVGTWHEFTVAFETNKPIAVLDAFGGVASEFRDMLKAAGRWREDLIFEQDPVVLVDKLIAELDERRAKRRT